MPRCTQIRHATGYATVTRAQCGGQDTHSCLPMTSGLRKSRDSRDPGIMSATARKRGAKTSTPVTLLTEVKPRHRVVPRVFVS